jgi:hypothetical protein
MSNAPDESPETEEEYQRRTEALEDYLHCDAVKLAIDFNSKELEATLTDRAKAPDHSYFPRAPKRLQQLALGAGAVDSAAPGAPLPRRSFPELRL